MTNKHMIALATALTVMAATTSCSSDEPQPADSEKYGTLSTRSLVVNVAETDIARSAGSNGIDWTVEIMQDSKVVTQYTYEDLPEVVKLYIGDYTVNVHSPGKLEDATFDSPYYEGSQDFRIEENLITEVGTVVCRLVNTKVSIVIDDLLESLTGGNWTVKAVADNSSSKTLVFKGGSSDGQPATGYFNVAAGSTITATFTGTVSGEEIEMKESVTVADPGTEHHIFNFSVKTADGV